MQQEIKWQGGRAVGDSAPVTITALLLQATLFLGNKASSSCHCFETVSGQKEIYNFPKQQLQEQQEKKKSVHLARNSAALKQKHLSGIRSA